MKGLVSAAAAAPVLLAQGQSTRDMVGGLVVPLVLMFGIFYFLVIGPQRKHQKKIEQMRGALKAGDKVITSGGIYGTVVGVEDEAVQLRVAEQVRIKVARSAIAGLQAEPKESQ